MSSLRAGKPSPQPGRDSSLAGSESEANSVTLGPRDRLIGQLYIEGDLRVDGTLEGEVEATGDVAVSEAATVKASVAGREVSISGQVNGAVTASKKLVVSRGGSLNGDVRVPRLVIQDGATFNGNVSMSTGATGPRKAEAALEATPPAVEAAPATPDTAPAAGPEKTRPKRR